MTLDQRAVRKSDKVFWRGMIKYNLNVPQRVLRLLEKPYLNKGNYSNVVYNNDFGYEI